MLLNLILCWVLVPPSTVPWRGSEGAPLGGGRADRAGDAARQASPKGGRGHTQDTRRSR